MRHTGGGNLLDRVDHFSICMIFGIVVLAALLVPALAIAGNNSSAAATLSWNLAGHTSDIPSTGTAQPRLFVKIVNAPDARAIAITIRWSPRDSTSSHYDLTDPIIIDGCSEAFPGATARAFDGDSTFTWVITDPAPGDSVSVVYGVTSGTDTTSSPATFFLASVRILDSQGRIDVITPESAKATIAGGASIELPFMVESIGNRFLARVGSTPLSVWGHSFTGTTRVFLRAVATGTEIQLPTTLVSSSKLIAVAPVIDSSVAFLTMVLRDSAIHDSCFAIQSIVNQDTTVATGNGLNGSDLPYDLITSHGVLRKVPGSALWVAADTTGEGMFRYWNSSRSRENRSPLSARLRREQSGKATSNGTAVTDCQRRDLVFTDNFEYGYIDTDLWELGYTPDRDPAVDEVWGVANNDCAGRSNSNYSAHCSQSCNSFPPAMGATLISRELNLLPYDQYDMAFYAKQNAYPPYSGLRWGYIVNGEFVAIGNYAGVTFPWGLRGVHINNAVGDSSQFQLYFGFDSEDYVTNATGAYIDDVSIKALPRSSNLAAVAPIGAAQPIVVSATSMGSNADTLFCGSTAYARCGVRNVGSANVLCAFSVRLLLDGTTIKDTLFSTGLLWDHQVDIQVGFQVPELAANARPHALSVEVDYGYDIDETDDSDNAFPTDRVWVFAPNLVVLGVTATPNPQEAGGLTDISATIKNVGGYRTSSVFFVGFYKNRSSAPVFGTAADTSVLSSRLLPGQSRVLHFQTTAPAIGAWNTYAYVDPSNVCFEGSHESDNASGAYAIVWSAPLSGLSGEVAFHDSLTGVMTPVRRAKVVFIDVASNPPDTVGGTYTDAAGHYGPVILTNSSTHHAGPLQVRVLCQLQTNLSSSTGAKVVVRSPLSEGPWRFDSGAGVNIPNGAAYLDSLKPALSRADIRKACHVFEEIQKASASLGSDLAQMPTVTVLVDRLNAGSSIAQGFTITLNGDGVFVGPDEYNDTVIWHEYGHVIANKFGFCRSAISLNHSLRGPSYITVGGQQVIYTPTAWSEGWADFFAGYARGLETVSVAVGSSAGTTYRLETGFVVTPTGLGEDYGSSGSGFEMSVASALWDIVDAVNEPPGGPFLCPDNYSAGYAMLWSKLKQGIPLSLQVGGLYAVDVGDFYRLYTRSLPTLTGVEWAALDQVFCLHALTTAPPSSGVDGDPLAPPPASAGLTVVRSLNGTLLLRLNSEGQEGAPIVIDVFSVDGRRVSSATGVLRGGSAEILVPLGNGKAGVYFVGARCGAVRFNRKAVILQ